MPRGVPGSGPTGTTKAPAKKRAAQKKTEDLGVDASDLRDFLESLESVTDNAIAFGRLQTSVIIADLDEHKVTATWDGLRWHIKIA